MNWNHQPQGKPNGGFPVAICETQPVVVEGVTACLAASGIFNLAGSARSLEDAARLVITTSPRIILIDKAFGGPAIMDWISRIAEICPSLGVVVWGASMTESEALRYLKVGAKGIVRKTAEVADFLSCLESVAEGMTWMEDSLFQELPRSDRQPRMDLTPREQQVMELVEQGLRNKDIARELGIRPGTVKIHLKHIFEKTGVRGRYGLALSGLREKAAPALMTV